MPQWLAGERITAAKLSTLAGDPGIRTSLVGSITTTETVLDQITVPVVAGRQYRVWWRGNVQTTIADGYGRLRLREDSVSGTQVGFSQQWTATVINQSFPTTMEGFWTAPSTGDKIFVATLIRQSGTGVLSSYADASTPANFFVENISGA